ncbi:MAG: di-trans,poly-cis-decaprenylcistransferase [Burkholderiaceae bacterium]|nr:di-trans,poly-cis-decaprenylcistransferase [Burkholderiaceae bacterium]
MIDPQTQSSTLIIPAVHEVPQHIAMIMDGNGRWANARHLPRVVGHERGVAALRQVVEACMRRGVRYLTVFAFSSENWRRPEDEVSFLMGLFIKALEREVRDLKANGVRLRVIGDLSAFSKRLRDTISRAEQATAENEQFYLTVAANYGGRWDILQATRKMLDQHPELAAPGRPIPEELLSPHLSMNFAPEPDLFIRTGGEERISNFLLWQLAYTEFYFTDCFWPEFDDVQLGLAIASYQQRERRFGRTSAQVAQQCSVPVS